MPADKAARSRLHEADMRLGILASSRGSNFAAIADACRDHTLAAEVAVLITNNSRSGAMQFATSAGIPTLHASGKTHPHPADLDRAICACLCEHQVDLVVLAGYMKQLGDETLNTFNNRIINIHPALLPRHGGKGMFGRHVHEAVLRAGDTVSGASVHFVTRNYDEGAVIKQQTVPVLPNDTVDELAARVRQTEHKLLIDTIRDFSSKPWQKNQPGTDTHAHP